jgi:hypothetical protein
MSMFDYSFVICWQPLAQRIERIHQPVLFKGLYYLNAQTGEIEHAGRSKFYVPPAPNFMILI